MPMGIDAMHTRRGEHPANRVSRTTQARLHADGAVGALGPTAHAASQSLVTTTPAVAGGAGSDGHLDWPGRRWHPTTSPGRSPTQCVGAVASSMSSIRLPNGSST